MEKVQLIEDLFQKKLGIILKNSREIRKRSIAECATSLGISVGEYELYEEGKKAPSLPELEILAYFLEVPIEHFFLSRFQEDKFVFETKEDLKQFFTVRDKVIATRLKTYREQKNIPVARMIQNTNLTEDDYLRYEDSFEPIPLTKLQAFMHPLGISLKDFLAEGGKMGAKYRKEKASQILESIPEEVQKFLINPSNEPYLRLAIHLSSLSAEKLRNIAEGLLEITY